MKTKIIFIIVIYCLSLIYVRSQTYSSSSQTGSGYDWTIQSGYYYSSPSKIIVDGDGGYGGSILLESGSGMSGAGNIILNAVGGSLLFRINGTTKMTIGSDGNVKIAKFYDSDNTGYYIDPSASTSVYAAGKIYGTNFYGNVFYSRSNTSYYIYPSSASTSINVAGAIKTSGKIGIGAYNSDYHLNIYNSTRPLMNIENLYGRLQLGIYEENGYGSYFGKRGDIIFKALGSQHGIIFNLGDNSNDGNSYIKFGDDYNYEVMAIYNNATVKIDGKLYAKSIEVIANVWGDFVFKDNYKLKSLKEIENYIKENQHLPDLPSEHELIGKGYDISEMDAKLLQKIEELTLYIIEQDKEIEQLKEKIETMKTVNN
ncbi:MAG: hypothetical protein JXB17_02755 [Bacteroidales bacterium]|nr:hypothetical protein [Bacteroidales bacterium]